MNSKNIILNKIGLNKPLYTPLVEIPMQPICIGSLKEKFKSNLALAGGSLIEFISCREAEDYLLQAFKGGVDIRNRERYPEFSACPSLKLDGIGTVILEAHFGVAENGAVWLNDSSFPQRIIPFIAENLVIFLSSDTLVNDMGEAYRNITLTDTGFGLFISGPSKTADIEQSLVYGAHGPKEMVVLLY